MLSTRAIHSRWHLRVYDKRQCPARDRDVEQRRGFELIFRRQKRAKYLLVSAGRTEYSVRIMYSHIQQGKSARVHGDGMKHATG